MPDEMSAEEWNRYQETGVLPERLRPQHTSPGTQPGPVLPLRADRIRRAFTPYIPPAGYEQMPEKQLQREIRALAKGFGWLPYHTRNSMQSDAGFPDLVLAHPAYGVVFLELKGPKGRISDEQRHWVAILQASGQQAWIVTGADLPWINGILQGYHRDELE